MVLANGFKRGGSVCNRSAASVSSHSSSQAHILCTNTHTPSALAEGCGRDWKRTRPLPQTIGNHAVASGGHRKPLDANRSDAVASGSDGIQPLPERDAKGLQAMNPLPEAIESDPFRFRTFPHAIGGKPSTGFRKRFEAFGNVDWKRGFA